MEFQGGLKMIKNIRSMILSINIMEIGSFFPIFILIESVINIINAIYGYNMALLNGEFWYPANTFFSIIPVLFVSIIASNYVNCYKLLIAMPIKLDKSSIQIMTFMDFAFLSVIIIDIIVMSACHFGYAILLKAAAMLMIYAASYIVFYLNIRTGFKFYGITGKVLSIVVSILIYCISSACYTAVSCVIYDYQIELSDSNMIIIGVFIAAVVISLLARILSYKGVNNVVRQSKIYKINNKKKDSTKLESYV